MVQESTCQDELLKHIPSVSSSYAGFPSAALAQTNVSINQNGEKINQNGTTFLLRSALRLHLFIDTAILWNSLKEILFEILSTKHNVASFKEEWRLALIKTKLGCPMTWRRCWKTLYRFFFSCFIFSLLVHQTCHPLNLLTPHQNPLEKSIYLWPKKFFTGWETLKPQKEHSVV